MLEHTERQVHKWKFLQHALSRYVYNRSLFVIFTENKVYLSRQPRFKVAILFWTPRLDNQSDGAFSLRSDSIYYLLSI